MRGSSGVKAFLVILIVGILAYVALAGVSSPGLDIEIKKVNENIRYGIDIRGGVRAVLSPDEENATDDQMDTARGIIEARLDAKQIYDRTVTIDRLNKRIIIEIPHKKDNDAQTNNPQKVMDELGGTALLTFQRVDESKRDEITGDYIPTGNIDDIVLEGTDVIDARPEPNPQTGVVDVSLTLSDKGAEKFGEATTKLVGQKIGIFLDDHLVSAPTVNEPITGTKSARITLGRYNNENTAKEAKDLAAVIKAGALPFKLISKDVNGINPILGKNALTVSENALVIAILLVWVFMILVYRLQGLIANIALLAQVTGILMIIAVSNITLTLPGIAGIILTIGMSVDANVIIFERVKEEIRNGKTVQAAVDVGFKRAFTAIVDGNITTLIAAVVLYVFGSGSIQSFALTLGLGVVLNFITAILFSRILLTAVSGFVKKHWLYGVKGGAANV